MHSSAFPWLSDLTDEEAYAFLDDVTTAAQDAGTHTAFLHALDASWVSMRPHLHSRTGSRRSDSPGTVRAEKSPDRTDGRGSSLQDDDRAVLGHGGVPGEVRVVQVVDRPGPGGGERPFRSASLKVLLGVHRVRVGHHDQAPVREY